MKKNISKKLILYGCLQKQNELIENIEKRINALKADVFNYSQSTSQSENRAAGKIDLLNALENELIFAKTENKHLESIDPSKENASVESGAVVITNHLIFFIGISGEKIEIEGEVIQGISTKAPIYSFMHGLKKGNTFSYNEKAYEILNVY